MVLTVSCWQSTSSQISLRLCVEKTKLAFFALQFRVQTCPPSKRICNGDHNLCSGPLASIHLGCQEDTTLNLFFFLLQGSGVQPGMQRKCLDPVEQCDEWSLLEYRTCLSWPVAIWAFRSSGQEGQVMCSDSDSCLDPGLRLKDLQSCCCNSCKIATRHAAWQGSWWAGVARQNSIKEHCGSPARCPVVKSTFESAVTGLLTTGYRTIATKLHRVTAFKYA
jgi:hypothetical protein